MMWRLGENQLRVEDGYQSREGISRRDLSTYNIQSSGGGGLLEADKAEPMCDGHEKVLTRRESVRGGGGYILITE